MKQLNLWYSAQPAEKAIQEADNKSEQEQPVEITNKSVEVHIYAINILIIIKCRLLVSRIFPVI